MLWNIFPCNKQRRAPVKNMTYEDADSLYHIIHRLQLDYSTGLQSR